MTVGRAPFGHVLEQAIGPVTAIEVLSTDDYDARLGLESMPEVLSAPEAAALLGVSRQAILQRLESGSLTGIKVGNSWVIQRARIDPKHPERLVRRRRVTDEAASVLRAPGCPQ